MVDSIYTSKALGTSCSQDVSFLAPNFSTPQPAMSVGLTEARWQGKTKWLYCDDWTQHSIRPKRSAIRAQAVRFLHSTMPSVTCLRMSDVSVICRVTYFQFPIQSAFLPHVGRQAAPALRRTISFDTQYRTSDVAENLGRYLSCAECAAQWKDFELILTVKVETRHTVEGQFGSEFPAICNHCVLMTAWSRKTWNLCKEFLLHLKKTPMVKFL